MVITITSDMILGPVMFRLRKLCLYMHIPFKLYINLTTVFTLIWKDEHNRTPVVKTVRKEEMTDQI